MVNIDIFIYAIIAIMYNLLVHNLASITYQDLQYEEKHDSTIIMLVIFGILGVGIAKMLDKHKKYANKYAKNGLYYGGILLILTALLTNWTDIGGELRLIGVGVMFGLLIWYCYKIDNDKINDKK
jgi:hypothetical protein